jgi:hypothetical protein
MTGKAKIQNCEANPEKYIVARLVMGVLWFWGSWETREAADRVASQFDNGLVLERDENEFRSLTAWEKINNCVRDIAVEIMGMKADKVDDEPCSECKHHDIEDGHSGYCDYCYAGEYFKPKGGRG